MLTLPWGDSGALRESLHEMLSALATISTNRNQRSLDLVLALRFRRMALNSDQHVPRDYTYAVDVALPSAAPEQIRDMLDSRAPTSVTRYDLVRVRLWMPAQLPQAAAARDGPMLLELLNSGGASMFGKDAEAIAAGIGNVDVVHELNDQNATGTLPDVRVGLTAGVNRNYQKWVPRPANLFRTLELPMAILRALDGPNSPCDVVARLHRLIALRGASMAYNDGITQKRVSHLVDYQPGDDAARFEGGGSSEGRVSLSITHGDGYIIVYQQSVGTDGRSQVLENDFDDANPVTVGSAHYPLTAQLTISPRWDPQLTIPVPRTEAIFHPVLVIPSIDGAKTEESILRDAAAILADLMQMEVPTIFNESFGVSHAEDLDWAQLFLVRAYKDIAPYFPRPVIEELMTAVIGTWSYYLMTKSVVTHTTQFWYRFAFHLVSRYDTTRTVLQEVSTTISPSIQTTTIDWFTPDIDTDHHPDYARLARAVGLHVIPFFGRFKNWAKR